MTAHSKEPPTLPVIVDEAGDTPTWLPIVGIGGLVLIAIVIAMRLGVFGANVAGAPAAEPAPTAEAAPAPTAE
jgi:hypothetical protein